MDTLVWKDYLMSSILWAILFTALPVCHHEDSPNCSWDGGTNHGAYTGSFYDIDGIAYYMDGSFR